MFGKTAIVLVLLVGIGSIVLGAPTHAQSKHSGPKAKCSCHGHPGVIGQGLFAEEYDAILEAPQDNPHLRQKIIKHGHPK